MKNIVIVGAGLTGTLMAIYLAKQGHQVSVFEKRSDPRKQKEAEGRSINLALSARGMKALEHAELLTPFLQKGVAIYGRIMHDLTGKLTTQPYGRSNSDCNYAISRKQLNDELLVAASNYDNIKIYFEHVLTSYELSEQKIMFENANRLIEFAADVVVGADGAFSKVRQAMMQQSNCKCELVEESYGYKELIVSKELGESLQSDHLHIWPRSIFMLMSLANHDGSHTLTLYMPLKGENSFESLNTKQAINDFFQQNFVDIKPLLPDLTSQFMTNPIGKLFYTDVKNYFHQNQSILVGDAAHAMVPFLGQGMNCGFEDVRLLSDAINKNTVDDTALFNDYYQERKPNTDAIIAMALDNYEEMRSNVGDQNFQLKKQVERVVMEKYPTLYLSKYVIISYSHRPYNEAKQLGLKQDQFLEKITQGIQSIDDVDWDQVESSLKSQPLN